MTAALGIAGVALAFVGSVSGAALFAGSARGGGERSGKAGYVAVAAVLLGAVLSVSAMEWALITRDFSLQYVADNGSRSTPLIYTVASLWAALEGSILLWGLVLAGYLAFVAWRFRQRAADPLVLWALAVGLLVAAFFFGLMLGPANPFRTVAGPVPVDGPGPNPLLQNHPLMAFHPPILYLGYVGFTVPFAFAVASLVTGRMGEGWLVETRRATLFAWGSLTLGIALGGWWSYEVLGWGGYWAWDPVENASLLPWLTATAYLHSVVVQERRGMLRLWNLSLVMATFCLTILGTFLTRSGVVNSVHAFAQSTIGPALLAFLGVTAAACIILVAWRAEDLASPGRIDSPLSREAAFLGNNLLFGAFTLVVLLGTVFPLVAEALDGRQVSVGAPFFDDMTRPIGFVLLFLMAVAPALPWRAASPELLHRRLFTPAAVAIGAMVVSVAAGLRGISPVLTVGLAVFALTGITRQVFVATRATRRVRDAGWLASLATTVSGNRRLYGGLIVHVGVVLVAVAIAMSSAFATERSAQLAVGESVRLSGYQVTYLDSGVRSEPGKAILSSEFRITSGNRHLGNYAPSITRFEATGQPVGTPSVRTGLVEDVYLSLLSPPDDDGRIGVAVRVNPMIVWLWIGVGVMAAGTALAGWPARRRRISRPPPPAPLAADLDDTEPEPERLSAGTATGGFG